MKFLHAADVHLDSPLRGLEAYGGAPVDRLRLATRRALEKIVNICLEEDADFLIVAGDLFDTDCKDFNSALLAANQMRILKRAGIPVYLILGNHDSRDEATRQVPWPDNVTVFDHKRPHTIFHESLPVALHGMSYPRREVTQNLVPDYPAPVLGKFNIGLLHANAGGNADHDPYAPCSVDELVAKRYDYWALGHVHDYQLLHEHPHVVYSGNTQGRHARETGAKGCVLVTVNDGQVISLDFRETDVVRWHRAQIELQPDDDGDALLDRTRSKLLDITQSAEGRLAAVRLEYVGQCAIHQQLVRDVPRQQIVANIRSLAEDVGDVWIEKVKFHTRSRVDVASLRQGQDLIGELLRELQSLAGDPVRLRALTELLQPLVLKVGAELAMEQAGPERIEFDDPRRLADWLREAEQLLVSHLVEDPQ